MAIGEEMMARLLAPIAGGEPVGPDGRHGEGEPQDRFRTIRSTANDRRKAESALQPAPREGGEPMPETQRENWSQLASETINYLSADSKDLEIACILVEALVRDEGLEGLSDGLGIVTRLIKNFWEQGLYPREDEDGENAKERIEARYRPLEMLGGSTTDGRLFAPLRRIDLIPGLGFTKLIELQVAGEKAGAAEGSEREAALAAVEAGRAAINARAQEVGLDTAKKALGHIRDSIAAWDKALAFVAERTAPNGPSAPGLGKLLKSAEEWLQGLFKERLEADAGVIAPADAAPGQAATAVSGSRATALAQIAAAAEYFERAEPLSPIGPALRQTHRRARLTFHDMVREVIPNERERESFYLHSGIKQPQN